MPLYGTDWSFPQKLTFLQGLETFIQNFNEALARQTPGQSGLAAIYANRREQAAQSEKGARDFWPNLILEQMRREPTMFEREKFEEEKRQFEAREKRAGHEARMNRFQRIGSEARNRILERRKLRLAEQKATSLQQHREETRALLRETASLTTPQEIQQALDRIADKIDQMRFTFSDEDALQADPVFKSLMRRYQQLEAQLSGGSAPAPARSSRFKVTVE